MLHRLFFMSPHDLGMIKWCDILGRELARKAFSRPMRSEDARAQSRPGEKENCARELEKKTNFRDREHFFSLILKPRERKSPSEDADLLRLFTSRMLHPKSGQRTPSKED